jgi:hypothetical protein
MNNCIFKNTKRGGKRVVMGPTSLVKAGATVTVDGADVAIDSVGRSFERSGVECCYGYGDFPNVAATAGTTAPAATDEIAQLRAEVAASAAQVAQLLRALGAEQDAAGPV